MSCRKCSCVVQAPAPQRVIDRGLPGPGLLAHVITSKFADHTPLYRQSQIFTREGIELDRSILARWVGEAAALLAPVAEVLSRYVLATDKLHGDDTRSRCSRQERVRPRPVASGHTFVTTGQPGTASHPQCGFPIRLIARENIHSGTWPSSPVSCRRMPSQVITGCIRAERFRKLHAWRTSDASSSTSSRCISRRSPPRPLNALLHCIASRRRSRGNHLKNDA